MIRFITSLILWNEENLSELFNTCSSQNYSFKNMFGDTIFDGILILAVWHNRTRTVFSQNAETALHHCTAYVLFMYNMHPMAKCVDEIQCSHFSIDPKQVKDLFLPMLLQTTDIACIIQTVSNIRCHDTDCSTSKDIALTCVQVRRTLQTDCAQAGLSKYAILG
jgi:hypothetical protein